MRDAGEASGRRGCTHAALRPYRDRAEASGWPGARQILALGSAPKHRPGSRTGQRLRRCWRSPNDRRIHAYGAVRPLSSRSILNVVPSVVESPNGGSRWPGRSIPVVDEPSPRDEPPDHVMSSVQDFLVPFFLGNGPGAYGSMGVFGVGQEGPRSFLRRSSAHTGSVSFLGATGR
jgi:hypothetical protein